MDRLRWRLDWKLLAELSHGCSRIVVQMDRGEAVVTTGGSANTYYVGYLEKAGSGFDDDYKAMNGIHFLNFGAGPIKTLWGATSGRYIMFPLYFPAVVSSIVLWLARRIVVVRTMGGAFPVEQVAKIE
jgi:hypothetical protein